MKKISIIACMLILLSSLAAAETCFTSINVPQSNKYNWKAITYTEIIDDNYANYLTKPNLITAVPGLGPGYQYQIRTDANCFEGYLLSNADFTGMATNQLTIQRKDMDYSTTDFQINKIYTISIQENDARSSRLVSQISTATIDGINYLSLPSSFNDMTKHPKIKEVLDSGLCDPTLTVSNQIDKITFKIWTMLTYNESVISCSSLNMVDCALTQGYGRSQEYAAAAMVLARKCGIPSRVVYGITEAAFDGVDMKFNKDKSGYWLEYYDGNEWFEANTIESGTVSMETNCIDSIDNDNNGKIDCYDDACKNTFACSSWPTTRNFDNAYSTDFDTLKNPYDIQNLTLGNAFGSVTWTNQHLDLRGKNIDSALSITSNLIDLNNQVPELNKEATATIMTTSQATGILKDGQKCATCVIQSNAASKVTFTIPGIGKYSAEYAPPPVENVTVTAPPPVIKDDLPTRIWDRVKTFYNKLTTFSKVLIVIVILGLLWLWRRRRNRMYYGR